MHILIDSHILLWLMYRPSRLPTTSKELLRSADSVCVSTASVLELTLKFAKKKLPYPPDELIRGINDTGFTRLAIRDEHLQVLPDIKLPHADPFDRLLIAQSETEGYRFLTADALILRSGYQTIQAAR